MEFNREHQPPSAPLMWPSDLPQEEQAAGASLIISLRSLEGYAREFLAAVALFDYCEQQPPSTTLPNSSPFFHWQFLAARGGAMSIYNYAKAMAGVRSVLGLCPTWLALVDGKALKAVEKEFGASFPFYYQLRQAVAHAAELWEHPTKIKINSPETGPVMINHLNGRSFETSYEGNIVKYDVAAETVITLNELTRGFYAGFDAVDLDKRERPAPQK